MKLFASLVSRLIELRPVVAERLSSLWALILRLSVAGWAVARAQLKAAGRSWRARRDRARWVQLQLFDPDLPPISEPELELEPEPEPGRRLAALQPAAARGELELQPEPDTGLLDRINAYSLTSTAG